MFITHLRLKNWRNFRNVDVKFKDVTYIMGPNASGKSNFLDVFRFLRDIATPQGGGLQQALESRGGMSKVRCLAARQDPKILIEIELSENFDSEPLWRYTLEFQQESRGKHAVYVSKEDVFSFKENKRILSRPDKKD